MTTTTGRAPSAQGPVAPAVTTIEPCVFVAVRGVGGRLLLVHRPDDGGWGFPGGPMDVGETAAASAVRQTAADAGMQVLLTGIVGLFTDPRIVVVGPTHVRQQQFAVLFRARALGGVPHGDPARTSEAAWVAQRDLPQLDVHPPVRSWIVEALAGEAQPWID